MVRSRWLKFNLSNFEILIITQRKMLTSKKILGTVESTIKTNITINSLLHGIDCYWVYHSPFLYRLDDANFEI